MNLTKIDWFSFRSKSSVPEVIEGVASSFGSLSSMIKAKPRKNGWMGFNQSADITIDDMNIGLLAFGGESQNEWISVNISGRGCEWIPNIEQADNSLSSLKCYQTRRVDICLDTFNRETSHDKVIEAHQKGLFATTGRPPEIRQIISSNPRDGRTAYIGSRTSPKFFRGYEKGFELAAKYPNSEITHINSVPVEDIYRLELELKAVNAELPDDLIRNRDQYFAGAYPYLQTMIDIEPEVFIQRRDKGPQLDLDAALSNIRYQYGSTLFTALIAHHGDISSVWEKIVGGSHNTNLLESGVLLVQHD
jgi:DNA relaxase NicK